jgi:hypothetical protein
MSDGNDHRKERVIHTRVPAVLEQELKRIAESLRVPVSNVVRTILEDTVATIDSVGQIAEGELRDVANKLSRKRDALRARGGAPRTGEPIAPLAGIIGYQPLMLAREEHCSLCGRELAAGEQAFLGIRDHAVSASRVILGRECLPFSAGDSNKEQQP